MMGFKMLCRGLKITININSDCLILVKKNIQHFHTGNFAITVTKTFI